MSSQHDQVMAAMERLGGIATLSQLYHATLSGDAEWKTKTPHATIRRIVQTNAAFYKIKPGLYCLAARKREFERAYQLPTRGPISPEVAQLNHSYYQGVLVEIGNAKGHCTYVPPQDKNKKFVSVRLGKISSTELNCRLSAIRIFCVTPKRLMSFGLIAARCRTRCLKLN